MIGWYLGDIYGPDAAEEEPGFLDSSPGLVNMARREWADAEAASRTALLKAAASDRRRGDIDAALWALAAAQSLPDRFPAPDLP